jgi:hypothetical protein
MSASPLARGVGISLIALLRGANGGTKLLLRVTWHRVNLISPIERLA